MRRAMTLMAVAVTACLAAGCAGPEQKLGRGFRNVTEVTRLGEIRRGVEQGTLYQNRDYGYTSGFIHGMNRTLQRTAVGAYEIVTFPFPNSRENGYAGFRNLDRAVYPDSYLPRESADPFAQNTALGFHGTDVAPFIPGSQFRVFEY